MRKNYKRIKKSGILYDYTPIGIIVVGVVTIALLVITSLLLYIALQHGRNIGMPMLSAMVVGY